MPKFQIAFRVEQVLSGAIEVDAVDALAARLDFDEGRFDDQRHAARLDLLDSKDTIETIARVPAAVRAVLPATRPEGQIE